ncbi:MAG TPA: 3-oxoacyl-[acyl-carrier-protein] synthase III C-terminal domain-containing protein [Streptosporangiaceae bacterium]
MTSLEAVSTYLAPEKVSIAEILQSLGMSESQTKLYHRFYGYSHIRTAPGASITSLMLCAAAGLDALPGRENQVHYVIAARTIQMAAPYPDNPLQDVRRKLGLDHAIAFAVSQHGCASGLLAIHLADRLLAAEGDPSKMALVFTGEKALRKSTQVIRDSAVMGESSAAFLVRCGGEKDKLLAYATRAMGQFCGTPFLTKDMETAFKLTYPDALAEVLLAAVALAGAELSEIALVLPHNVNQLSWIRLCVQIGLPSERVFLDNLPRIGHCFCADNFINYQTACEQGRLHAGDKYAMVSVGLGATFSAMIFRH